jgi:hypothetical protein
MQSKAATVAQYLAELPEDRKEPIRKLRQEILGNIPKGFEEGMSYGMIGYYVPHKLYPDGYHCNPKDPLPFMCLASQKNFIAVYHMGVYAEGKLHDWFVSEYARQVPSKLDMGKSCIRLKKMDQIPFKLFGELASKITPQQWIKTYEDSFKNNRKEK